MAITRYHNITGSTGVTTTLLSSNEIPSKIFSILITNIHSSNAATVTLFIQDDPAAAAASTFYIISTVAIPSDSTLILDNPSVLSFNNSNPTEGYGLYLTVGSSDTLDVMINV